jgi:hypothetical protein
MSLSPLVAELHARAFAHAAPAEANLAIEAQREARSEGGRLAWSYEVALPALGPDEYLKARVLPKLVYFLDCRGARLPQTPGVFVSLFTAEGLCFVDAGAVVSCLAEARGLDLLEVVRRYGERGAGDPALLGG